MLIQTSTGSGTGSGGRYTIDATGTACELIDGHEYPTAAPGWMLRRRAGIKSPNPQPITHHNTGYATDVLPDCYRIEPIPPRKTRPPARGPGSQGWQARAMEAIKESVNALPAHERHGKRLPWHYLPDTIYTDTVSYNESQMAKLREIETLDCRGKPILTEDGEPITIADAKIRTADHRISELKHIVWATVNHLYQAGKNAYFFTQTLPGKYHAIKGCTLTPRQKADMLQRIWVSIRKDFDRAGISVDFLLSVEPHQDGTPHVHGVLLFEPQHANRIRKILESHIDTTAPNHDRQLRIQEFKHGIGGAVRYMAKSVSYMRKQGDNRIDRIRAWRQNWRIRGWKSGGKLRLTAYRDIRRIGPDPTRAHDIGWTGIATHPDHRQKHAEKVFRHIIQAARTHDYRDYLTVADEYDIRPLGRDCPHCISFKPYGDDYTVHVACEAGEFSIIGYLPPGYRPAIIGKRLRVSKLGHLGQESRDLPKPRPEDHPPPS